ncbi:LINE-type retrotransposon LIb DNA [Senna tora]|uniref:LINE-type retrotransposon LIb DNA n=1 Tax=Senna tora TaxID=362788 RepID=A0A834TTC6_9FABA|nr:LINE-type retrotransposon LIb DNA [Senna tora]
MQAIFLPINIHNKIDKINRNFLWGHSHDSRKLHYVNWNTITQPKTFGGLGIRQSHKVNECYMAKILWNIKTDNNSLSSQIIKAKYGQNLERNIHSKSYIRRSLDKGLSVFNLGLAWRIGNGLSINFWHDKWLPSGNVRSSISGPLSLQDSHKSVSNVFSNGLSDISLSPPPSIIDEISSSFISLNNSPDFPAWPASNSGAFSINSFFKLNIDGSAVEGKLGAGGVIRNDAGCFIAGFSKFIGSGSALQAEFWALQLGLQLAIDQGIKNLEIESDALSLVQLFLNPNISHHHKFFSVISNCRHLTLCFDNWKLSHIYREANFVADSLANLGRLSRSPLMTFFSPPDCSVDHLLHDSSSFGKFRCTK